MGTTRLGFVGLAAVVLTLAAVFFLLGRSAAGKQVLATWAW